MEIPAWMFFSFWALAGGGFFYLGIKALENPDLPNPIPPVIMSLFKYALAIFTCHSSTYALVFRPKLNKYYTELYLGVPFAVFSVVFNAADLFSWHFPSYSLVYLSALLLQIFSPKIKMNLFFFVFLYAVYIGMALITLHYLRGTLFGWYFSIFVIVSMVIYQLIFAASWEGMSFYIHFAATSSLFLIGGKTEYYFPILVLLIAYHTSAAQAALSGNEHFQRWLGGTAAVEDRMVLELKRNGKVIKYAIGIGGIILFQNFFPLTSFDHVMAFLYFGVAWLANLALLLSNHDLGIFNFLLSNVIVGCTVSQFGFRVTTWLVYAVSILLYILRLKLEELSLVKRGVDEAAVIAWRDDTCITSNYMNSIV